MDNQTIVRKNSWKTNPVLISLFVYSVVWVSTGVLGRLFWAEFLPKAKVIDYLLAFILPLLLVESVAFWFLKHENPFRLAQFFFVILGAFIILNVFIFHFKLLTYGDDGQLSKLISEGTVFPRWMLGSSIMKLFYQWVVIPIGEHTFLPLLSSTNIVRLSGCLLMTGVSVLLLRRHPNRLSVVLPLTTPIWLLFSTGYNEYYPFIAPVFICVLLLLFEWDISKVHPIVMGLLLSSIALLYAGFVPLSVFLMIGYVMHVKPKTWIQAAVFSLLWGLLLLLLFWPDTLKNFAAYYKSALNLGDSSSISIYVGKATPNTPFFNLPYAFSLENLKRQFFMFFWAGGLSPLYLMGALIYAFIKKIQFKNLKKILFLGLFLGYQVFYFIFLIPKLGPVADIDLYFTVYITFAFIAGFLGDQIAANLSLEKRKLFQVASFSMFAGNTAFILLYLLVLGLPIPH